MAIIRYKDLAKMEDKEINAKLSELRFELVKANISSNKTNVKTKEIKRAISRLLTFNKSRKDALKKK